MPTAPTASSPVPAPGPIPGFHAVVPAGGAGTRLWPLSRAGHPKFLHDLTGSGRTLLQATVDRLAPLVGDDGVLVVTGHRHADAVGAVGMAPRLAAQVAAPTACGVAHKRPSARDQGPGPAESEGHVSIQ